MVGTKRAKQFRSYNKYTHKTSFEDKDNPIIRSILKYKDDNIRQERLTTSNMADMSKYLFEPIYDEPLDDYFMGENPHSILE